MKLNKPVESVYTHEGAKTSSITPEMELRRSVMACMLWEDQFYESGVAIADRIAYLVPKVVPEKVQIIAIEARNKMKLRHVPLLLVREMVRHASHKPFVAQTLFQAIQRPDEITEFMAIYWKNGKCPIAMQVKKGLSLAFTKFNEYQMAKYNRSEAIKLRDVMFMVHAKPKDVESRWTAQERKIFKTKELTETEELYRKLVNNELATPDTWEVALSGGADKKQAFERLMDENQLGVLAFIRNMRLMSECGIDKQRVKEYSERVHVERALPFRFIAAARAIPAWEDVIEPMMLKCLEGSEKLSGKTILLVDVSGSMNDQISSKSDMKRLDAAYGLAVLLREICEDVEIYSFSQDVVQVPPRRGFALRDAVDSSQTHSSTYLGKALNTVYDKQELDCRTIVITDEQSSDRIPNPKGIGYIINVASYQRGIAQDSWFRINGWSESVIEYLREFEKNTL